ncbi:MAG: hypothetical protein GMKNLPBB_01774 [Myxococcota bacterium]|nr:hypothetical protein [Myxococcota bacterium]
MTGRAAAARHPEKPAFRGGKSMPRIIIVHGREVAADLYFPENKATIAIGRHQFADIAIDDPEISRRHATILRENGKYVIREMDATNGLSIKGQRVKEHVLKEGDEVDLGKYTLIFKGEQADEWGVTAEQQAKQVVQSGRVAVHAKSSRQVAAPTAETKFVDDGQMAALQQAMRQKRQAYLDVMEKGVVKGRVTIQKNRLVFGKGEQSDVKVGGWFSPKVAAAIEYKGNAYVLVLPKGEKNVFVNGEAPTSEPLAEGDQLTIRGKRFVFHDRVA